jgi:predicted nuclease of restriction endonuclease-like RecB superfamily
VISPDLVRVRKKNGVLSLPKPTADALLRARQLAEQVLLALAGAVQETRTVVDEALSELESTPQEKKLLLALKKLALDDSTFDGNAALDAPTLRREVFSRAVVARQGLAIGARFDREAVLAETAAALGVAVEILESGLYADLRSAERLLKAPAYDADGLLARHARAEVQAVLLCSVRVVVEVRCASADQYRALFHKLKFRQLLFQMTAREGGGYRIEIDGPYSLFESVTKYGLELALLLPALEACDSVKLEAELRWGKKRDELRFLLDLQQAASAEPSPPRDDIRALLEAFAESGAWSAEAAQEVLELPGIGLCVPDLSFIHRETGEVVLCEVLGFWNRAAVWRRIELVEQGLAAKIVFVVSARLRVSEEMLDGADSAALYVYKGAINPKALQRKLDELIATRPAKAKTKTKAKLERTVPKK